MHARQTLVRSRKGRRGSAGTRLRAAGSRAGTAGRGRRALRRSSCLRPSTPPHGRWCRRRGRNRRRSRSRRGMPPSVDARGRWRERGGCHHPGETSAGSVLRPRTELEPISSCYHKSRCRARAPKPIRPSPQGDFLVCASVQLDCQHFRGDAQVGAPQQAPCLLALIAPIRKGGNHDRRCLPWGGRRCFYALASAHPPPLSPSRLPADR